VTILEQSAIVGGKSCSIIYPEAGDDVPHEMGTCFMHPAYHRILKLGDDYDIGPRLKTGGDHFDSNNPPPFPLC